MSASVQGTGGGGMSKQPTYKMSRGDIVVHSFAGVYALPTQAQSERLVECANAMEPGGKVGLLLEAARGVLGFGPAKGAVVKQWTTLLAALAPFPETDPRGAPPRAGDEASPAEGLETQTEDNAVAEGAS